MFTMKFRAATALLAATTALLSPSSLRADTPAPGFGIVARESLPAPFLPWAQLSDGNRVTFDGEFCRLVGPSGATVQDLGSTGAGFAFPSFVIVDPGESFAVVGESSNHGLFKVDLLAGGLQSMGTVIFNYAACFETANTIVVSAAVNGFNLPNHLLRVDTTTFAQTPLGKVPGPSGPVAMNADGDLFYVTQSTMIGTPPGSLDVVRWTAAQVAAGNIGRHNWSIFAAGRDGGSALVIDALGGHLFLAEPVFFGTTNRIVEFDADGVEIGTVADTGANWCSNLQLLPVPGPGTFSAYQPAGVRLVYDSTDFATVYESVTVEPRRPTLTIGGPGAGGSGAITLSVGGAGAGTSVLLWREATTNLTPTEQILDLGLGFPLFSRLPAGTIQSFLDLIVMPPLRLGFFSRYHLVGPTGDVDIGYWNAPGSGGTLAYQAAIVSANGRIVGTTPVAIN